MAVPSPLPPRNGVNATRLRLPASGWPTAQDYVLHRLGHVDPDGIRARFARGEVVAADGTALTPTSPAQQPSHAASTAATGETRPSATSAPEPMTTTSDGTGGIGASRATSSAVSGWNHAPSASIRAAGSPPVTAVAPAARRGR